MTPMKAAILSLLLFGSSGHAATGKVDRTDLSAAEADARKLLSANKNCSLDGIASLRLLLNRYKRRPEPSLRLFSAQARSAAGFTTWFRMQRSEAKHWYKSIVRLYDSEIDVRFQVLVANANYMLARSGGSRRARLVFLDRVIGKYGATDDLQLLQIYARSLYEKSGVFEKGGQRDEARALVEQAQALYTKRIIPRLPPVADPDADDICI